jgi:hypothetical protein
LISWFADERERNCGVAVVYPNKGLESLQGNQHVLANLIIPKTKRPEILSQVCKCPGLESNQHILANGRF